jgi:RNA polymerase sigma-70 factor (ECF subfamily)
MPALENFSASFASVIDALFHRVSTEISAFGGLPRDRFAFALYESFSRRFSSEPSRREAESYLGSLHLADLALARACADSSEPAWDYFMRVFRPELYAAARAVCRRDDAGARDLADSLYAELYGVRGDSAGRRSLFEYFHGRSKLSTWLRAVLAQRHVDAVRAARRTESLDEAPESEHAAPPQAAVAPPDDDPHRGRYLRLVEAALTAALAALAPRERLRLSLYYLRGLTLAQIGRLTGEHEATVSRHLDRARRALRLHVEETLRRKDRMSDAQVRLCFEYATREWHFDLAPALGDAEAQEKPG